jgi:hypothetical protein
VQPPNRTLKAALASLHPTIGPLADDLGSQPGAGAPSVALESEEDGIPKKLVVLAGAGARPISRTNANALAGKGYAGEDHARAV